MGYHELLQALDDEVERQIRQIAAEAAVSCAAIETTIGRTLAERRTAALAAEERRLEEHARHALGRARIEQARAILVEQRRLLDEIRCEAGRRLAAPDDPALAARLVDEIAPELGEGAVEFRVGAGGEEGFVEALSRRHPVLARRATVKGVEGMGPGVVAATDEGRQLLDNSLRSRLDRAWEQMEGELAAELFGDLADGSRV